MNYKVLKLGILSLSPSIRHFSVTAARSYKYSCKLLIIGGGCGGCTMAAKFVRRLGPKQVIVLEPSEVHYYQPLWTLVGAGAKRLGQSASAMVSVLPEKAVWLKDAAGSIDPGKNIVLTEGGDEIHYEYLIVAAGMKIDYGRVSGLKEALTDPCSGVTTIFNPESSRRTWHNLQRFQSGEAIFTYPDTVIKCPGAPQKICYLADHHFNRRSVRSKVNLTYATSLPFLFGIKKYSDALEKVAARKKINVNYKTTLKEIRHDKREAVFKKTAEDGATTEIVLPYNLLHVGPPMEPPNFIRENEALKEAHGYLCVDKHTLQHTKYKNIYGIGDCTNTPNSKTVSAIAKQCYVVEQNLLETMKNRDPTAKYDGYGACPLLTQYGKCIMAEFIYGGEVHETFPYNQANESTMAYYMKKEIFPFVYWTFMLRGLYHGPELVRKILSPLKRDK